MDDRSTVDRHLDDYVRWVMKRYAPLVDFIVLYGSRAHGRHRPQSDYDLLIGLTASVGEKRFRDLLEDFDWGGPVHMEAKPFTPAGLDRLWFHFSRTLLDPLYEGVVVYDRGPWAAWQERYREAIGNGLLERRGTAWIWHKEREPVDSPRLAEDRRLQEVWRSSLTVT